MKSSVAVVHEDPRLHSTHTLVWLFQNDLHTDHIHVHAHTYHTSEVSNHLFIQAVELLSVFESGGMWHRPVAGTRNQGGHHRGGRGSRAKRQTAATKTCKISSPSFWKTSVFLHFKTATDKINGAQTMWKRKLLSASKYVYVWSSPCVTW